MNKNRKKRYLIILIAIWVLYGIYEFIVWRWSQNEIGAVIRVDLLIIYPLLLLLSIFLIFRFFKK